MNAIFLHPLLHPGGFGWDEYLLVGLGLAALIVIATMGGTPTKAQPAEDEAAMDEENS